MAGQEWKFYFSFSFNGLRESGAFWDIDTVGGQECLPDSRQRSLCAFVFPHARLAFGEPFERGPEEAGAGVVGLGFSEPLDVVLTSCCTGVEGGAGLPVLLERGGEVAGATNSFCSVRGRRAWGT